MITKYRTAAWWVRVSGARSDGAIIRLTQSKPRDRKQQNNRAKFHPTASPNENQLKTITLNGKLKKSLRLRRRVERAQLATYNDDPGF